MVLKVAVTGSRNWKDVDFITAKLERIKQQVDETGDRMFVLMGDARGADSIARQWAKNAKVGLTIYYADWHSYGKGAGPKRNQEIINAEPNILLAFPLNNSKGTWDCIRRAQKSGIETFIYDEYCN